MKDSILWGGVIKYTYYTDQKRDDVKSLVDYQGIKVQNSTVTFVWLIGGGLWMPRSCNEIMCIFWICPMDICKIEYSSSRLIEAVVEIDIFFSDEEYLWISELYINFFFTPSLVKKYLIDTKYRY